MRPYQFCNLVEVNGSDIVDQNDFNDRVRNATIIATVQAGYTEFHYLRDIWKKTTEEDALIGVGITGIAANKISSEWLTFSAELVKETNAHIASIIGINPAARTTTIKPSGTSSLVVGSSSGIHAYHNTYYLRRMRFGKDESIWKYLSNKIPGLCENEAARPMTMGVVAIPQKAPEGAFIRTESPIDLLNRTLDYNVKWVRKGHNYGVNANNVSVTVSVKSHEWEEVGNWMWLHREFYNGISVLPYDGGTYVQAPFEDITKEEYEAMVSGVHDIDLREVIENIDNTDLSSEAACAGSGCEVVF